ncbi:MAG TPA: DUF3800 domain-containing protein [bacterium]|jgi:hypothetical protein|nr:DUF3800 domain-containing protein [bacterium]
MNSWATAYVDETGTNDLDSSKPGVSHLFICVAVIVEDDAKAIAASGVQQTSKDLCGSAEISSKRVGGDHERRIRFLERLCALPFGYFALVINKDKIPKDSGLQYKRSFYKFINRMLYERLLKNGRNLHVIADEIGGKDFMDSFVPYFQQKGMPGLFEQFDHKFAGSAETPLIQLADFIAGTLSYCFDAEKKCAESNKFRELLRNKETAIQCWPWEITPVSPTAELPWSIDKVIRERMIQRVSGFLHEHENSVDGERRMQSFVLSNLFFARQFENRERQALVSDELMRRLAQEGFIDLSKQFFQARVIGKIRDEGIILAGSNDGYRLALSVEDIEEYLSHDKNIIEPMLARMLKARGSVLFDTGQKYDVLSKPEYHSLKMLANTFSDASLATGVAQISLAAGARLFAL